MRSSDGRVPVLYLAPWVDYGGSDKGTIDWFRWLDRDRFAPSLITTQPSLNRRLGEIHAFAEEVWPLPELLAGPDFPRFIFDFLHTRRVEVLHVMNSRLGFDLLPDLAALHHPPAVVVQLHVEEANRRGYVRYVTTRYGNLIDAFSVSSLHLAKALEDYDIPSSRIHVIPTGVDAEREFNPDLVGPIDQHEPGSFRVLFAGRLTEQKDPLLMVEVARRVLERHPQARFDVVGDGELQATVRARVTELGLGSLVRFHPPSRELARWMRASDAMLMTSTFEGVPYAIYEALAMGLPVVAPALPGNVELMDETGGILVQPRDDVDSYVDAISRLIEDHELRSKLADSGRARMRESFSLAQMASAHEQLYSRLIDGRSPAPPPVVRPPREPLRLPDRPARGTPLVSVITPCFNHGRFLHQLVEAISAQDYPAIETIVVDDASTDEETVEILAELEAEGRIRLLRQAQNSGPSAARNAALAVASGRYVLPVDADNVLLPGAITSLVRQLQGAGERVGYIYPRFQYFGNRDFRFDPPAFNLFALMHGNFADTGSLIDRRIFDAGIRYPEDIELGHEDWDLALELASLDIVGVPSEALVMLYRKQGFTRSDMVEYLRLPFEEEVRDRHPDLFGHGDPGAREYYKGPGAAIKARATPALSIIASRPIDFEGEEGLALVDALASQTTADFELVAECPTIPHSQTLVIRRIPPGLVTTTTERLQEAVEMSRGRYFLVSEAVEDLFADPTAVEKLLRPLWVDQDLRAIALVDSGAKDAVPYGLLTEVDPHQQPHSLIWRRAEHDHLLSPLTLPETRELQTLALAMHEDGTGVQWRHVSAGLAGAAPAETQPGPLDGAPPPRRARAPLYLAGRASRTLTTSERRERDERLQVAPALPALPEKSMRRWLPAWKPPETQHLVRHVAIGSGRRVVTNDRKPPPGHRIEIDLGMIQRFAPPGTIRLINPDGSFRVLPRGAPRDARDRELGHLEEDPLPLFIGIERAVLPDGTETLVASNGRDPLRSQARELEFLGMIESFPNEPVSLPAHTTLLSGVLMRWYDPAARCHRYTTAMPAEKPSGPGRLSAELGRFCPTDEPGTLALVLHEDGYVGTARYQPSLPRPDLPELARWSLAPLAWRGLGRRTARGRSAARRTASSTRLAVRRRRGRASSQSEGHRLGFVYVDPGPRRVELYSALHPVTGDQYLTHFPLEATDLGYGQVELLGYLAAAAPITGTLGGRRAGIPWASRFGLTARVRTY